MSIKLSENHIATFIRAANDSSLGWPLHLAPQVLQKASAEADDAYWKWADAGDKAEDATFDLPQAQAIWNKAAEDAVRDDKDLPTTKDLDRARIKIKVTAEDYAKAESTLKIAQIQLTKLLEDDSIRGEWRLAIEGEVSKLQGQLGKDVEKIDPVIQKLSLYLGLVKYLGDSGEYDYPPRVINPDPSESLNSMINAPAWKPVGQSGNISKL